MPVLDLELQLAGREIKNLDFARLGRRAAAGGQKLAIGRERQTNDPLGETIQALAQGSRVGVPKQDFLETTAGQRLAVRTYCQRFHERNVSGVQRLFVGPDKSRCNQTA